MQLRDLDLPEVESNGEKRQQNHGASEAEVEQIWSWNAIVPQPVERCVHDLIGTRVHQNPTAPAICAWDGNLTYEELDWLSTSLAHRLASRGIGSGSIVPLCFEKSKWMPVAALSVMKAGGASIALDTTQPEERLGDIIAQANARFILASTENEQLAYRLGINQVITVGHAESFTGSSSNGEVSSELPPSHPSDLLYAVYTSGSTGRPKGALITHRNFCSAIKHQQDHLGYTSSSRVFDFVSYAFDLSWLNLVHTLASGGCLCIPSQTERQNNIAGCIAKYNINFSCFTPSVARFIDQQALSKLSTLLLAGEAVLPTDATIVTEKTRITNGYGPAECTPISTILTRVSAADTGIGRGAGHCTWVVTVDGPEMLAPIGMIGELWLEGPLVGQGYLNDPEKTAEVFIHNPSWLLRGAPTAGRAGRCGRLYRTGDLVRYNKDGSLQYMGRKDTQVKIRGQRVELGEVEHHVRRVLEATSAGDSRCIRIVAETIKPVGIPNAILVVFVALGNADGMNETEHGAVVRKMTSSLAEDLEGRLPAYMLPSGYLPILNIPLTATGKTDRRSLRTLGVSLWLQHRNIPNGIASDNTRDRPVNEKERILQEVWMSVLNLPTLEVSIDSDFMKLGGDSITAMQVVSQCRAHGIVLTVGDVLRLKTIRNLAKNCRVIDQRNGMLDQEKLGRDKDAAESLHPSPIQQMYFDLNPDGANYFNQCSVLELTRFVPLSTLRRALVAIATRHPMLRARYKRNPDGHWQQTVAPEGPDACIFSSSAIKSKTELSDFITRQQERLDIENGPVFVADIISVGLDTQILVLTAHHLVIDLVSWRIIWNEIEDHVKIGNPSPKDRPFSFRSWLRLQTMKTCNLAPALVLPHKVPKADVDFWGMRLSDNTYARSVQHVETISGDMTNVILGEANASLRTDPIDILIGALVYSFFQSFLERHAPTMFIEGHGREKLDDLECDLSGTVGWFTTLQPLPIPIAVSSTPIDAVTLAKDIRRSIPGKGLPYFASRYYSEAGRTEFEGHDAMELLFNFTGRYQQLEKGDSLFKRAKHEGGEFADVLEPAKDTTRRLALIEIEAGVMDGQLTMSFRYHKDMRYQTRLKQWFQDVPHTLQAFAKILVREPAGFTQVDFPALPLSYQGLQTLREQLPSLGIRAESVADLLPCSPMQGGMLLSIHTGLASYANYWVWRCASTSNSLVSPGQLEAAWRAVVGRHPILSTVFTLHPGDGGFIQVTLSEPQARVSHVAAAESQCPAAALCGIERPEFAVSEPQYSFTICRSESGDVACRLDINHTLTDASSVEILLDEVMRHYSDRDVAEVPAFGEMVRYINGRPKEKLLAAWTSLLSGVQSCLFPLSSRSEATGDHGCITLPPRFTSHIADFCRDAAITRSVFLQVAWAMVLCHFTGMQEACFGYVASGRDAPIEGAERMVGPLANLLVARVNLHGTVQEVLTTTSEKSIEHLGIQHVSLAEIQHALGLSGKQLFNTILTIREKLALHAIGSQIVFQEFAIQDPHESALTLDGLLHGNDTRVSVLFRSSVCRQTAQEVCFTLTRAIEHIINSRDPLEPGTTKMISDASFEQIVGVNESAARSFWEAQFDGQEGTHFPPLRGATYSPQADGQIRLAIHDVEWSCSKIGTAALIRAAWSVVLAQSAGANEALFGTTTGQKIPSDNSRQALMFGEHVVPIRVQLDWNGSAGDLLKNVQAQEVEMKLFEKTGLQWIRRVSNEAAMACDFQTLIMNGDGGAADEPADPRVYPYSLVVQYWLEVDHVQLRISFDLKVITEARIRRLAHRFDHILHQLCDTKNGATDLYKLASISQRDLGEIWSWNTVVPEPIEACVHESIIAQARQTPEAPAVCAWDGDLSYGQLDALSTKLAYVLGHKGVGRDVIVPLCFEKSMWLPVAALAVMKAGGASVLMDPALPETRLQTITSQVGATLIISSVAAEELVRRLGPSDVMVIDQHHLANVDDDVPLDIELPVVDPSDLLYVVFTSGSSGLPKGVRIAHVNLSSALFYQKRHFAVTNKSRVLDFASYAFDMAWFNLLSTLTSGGCLCIPSTHERQNDLAGCLGKYKINYTQFTPSVARFIGRDQLSKLTTLVLAGESALPDDASLAGQVINGYGPAECTPISTVATLYPHATEATIGKGSGVCTWVVDTENQELLAPIGAIGELWIEGPLVGGGYLHDSERTKASFVQDPSWLLRSSSGKNGRHGRLYRTGDLVKYSEDGTLVFMGRKDTQVKIRGQRVELGEIEHHVRKSLEKRGGIPKMQLVAETIQPQDTANAILVIFVSIDDGNMTEDEHGDAVGRMTDGLTDELSQTLPAYMVPTAFIPTQTIPMTATGKMDRLRLRRTVAPLWLKHRNETTAEENVPIIPSNETERVLQQVWMTVLNLKAPNVPLNKPFTRLGGDSITAMQVVSQCRNHKISITVSDVLQASSITNLSSHCKVSSEGVGSRGGHGMAEDDELAPFGLSPVQQMFFDMYPNGLNHFNQSFVLELSKAISVKALESALEVVVAHHPMLRARFYQDENRMWKQKAVPVSDTNAFEFSERFVASPVEVGDLAQSRQRRLNIRHGPVFACDLFNVQGHDQIVVFTAHHLVIDLVSWRIIWGELEEQIVSGDIHFEPALSFQTWTRLQSDVGSHLLPNAVLPYVIPDADLGFWGISMSDNTSLNAENFTETLDTHTSSLILGPGNDNLRTETLDILLGALFHSFSRAFPDRTTPAVFLEGTVGWFTTLHPIGVPITSTNDIVDAVRLAKDTRRKVPAKGQPYFSCRYHNNDGRQRFKGHETMELLFNYMGRYQQLESSKALFRKAKADIFGDEHELMEVSESARRLALIEVNVGVENGQVIVLFSINREVKHYSRLKQWARDFAKALESAAQELTRIPASFTLADFPLLSLSYSGLDKLLNHQLPRLGVDPRDVRDMYPCTPTQEMALMSSHSSSTASYSLIWQVESSNPNVKVSPARLEAAWRELVKRHTIMATVFTSHPDGGSHVQIVLSEWSSKARVKQQTGTGNAAADLCKLEPSAFAANEPHHAFTTGQSKAGEVACRLDTNGAVIDQRSVSLLLAELVALYQGVRLEPAQAFSELVRYIKATQDEVSAYWTHFLDGIEPCIFPIIKSIQSEELVDGYSFVSPPVKSIEIMKYCRKMGIPRSVFLQVAWSLVLGHFAGMTEVCFGLEVAGRDIPIDGIDGMVGPLTNFLVCRMNLQSSMCSILESASQQAIEQQSMQHVSLKKILQSSSQVRALFNTSMSFQDTDRVQDNSEAAMSFKAYYVEETTKFDLTIKVNTKGADLRVEVGFRKSRISQKMVDETCAALLKALAVPREMASNLQAEVETLYEEMQRLSQDKDRLDTSLQVLFV
ncbi:Nonribosomal peptide synthase atnA [Cladobotryum mycophilum]|uniref:Nonribosomal peptide synthase atnA n=1 Tax=Cladobotryum mycophilum TaxID=491253 RepID=A0ABR0SWI1_9HYPO